MRAGADLRLLRAAVFAAACAALAAAGHLSAAGRGIPAWALAAGWLAAFAVALPLAGRERRSVPAMAGLLAVGQFALHCLYCLGQHAAAPAVSGARGGSDGGAGVVELAARLLCNDHAAGLSVAEARRVVSSAGLDVPAAAGTAQAGMSGHPPAGGLWGAGCALAEAIASFVTTPMLLGHLTAALAAGWLLRRGEAALWRLLALAASGGPQALARRYLCALFAALRRALRLALACCARLLPASPARPPRAGHVPPRPLSSAELPGAATRRGPPRGACHPLVLAA